MESIQINNLNLSEFREILQEEIETALEKSNKPGKYSELSNNISIGEFAEYLNCHKNTVRNWAKSNIFKTNRIGSMIRICKSDAVEFLEKLNSGKLKYYKKGNE
ncbi:hypothetical protein ES705_25667 [subsurface metagenome]